MNYDVPDLLKCFFHQQVCAQTIHFFISTYVYVSMNSFMLNAHIKTV